MRTCYITYYMCQANIEEIRAKYERKIKELEDDLIHNVSDDINSVVNSNTSFEEIKEENLSFQSSNSNSERNFLEEILNFDSTSKSYDIPNSSNIDNLTQVLFTLYHFQLNPILLSSLTVFNIVAFGKRKQYYLAERAEQIAKRGNLLALLPLACVHLLNNRVFLN